MKPVFSTISYGLYDIESSLVEDGFCIEKILEEIVAKTGLHIVKKQKHEFSPQGLSMTFILAESHIAIHTYPELKSAYITLTTCHKLNELQRKEILEKIKNSFNTDNVIEKIVSV